MSKGYEYSDQEYAAGGNGSVVDAIYHKAKAPMDVGNPYIEALPYPLTDIGEVARYYTYGLNQYDVAEKQLSRLDRRFLVNQIRTVRVALPFEQELEMEFYRTLFDSYRLRKLREVYEDGVKRIKLVGDVSEAANTGFNMLGFSGCGKSSAIKILVSRYPQVIRHHIDGEVYSQIVYLTISCQPNSNFSALYSGIGKAIDFALNTDIYQKQIDRIKTLAGKMNKVIELIELFAIGTIILDEIQLIDFKTTKESSFEALMVITNETKMAFCAVGTTEAYVKMFKEQRTARRLGREINASGYCGNEKFFSHVMSQLFCYQWFDEHIDLTEELVEAFYEESKGIIDQAVSLYIAVQDEYLKSNRKSISPEFIAAVSKRRYPNLKLLLERASEPGVQEQIEKIMRGSREQYEHELSEAKQQEVMQHLVQNAAEIDISSLIRRTIASIQQVVGSMYDEKQIEKACKDIASGTEASSIDSGSFIQQVFSMLQTGKARKSTQDRHTKRKSHKDMLQSILDET